MDTEELNRFQDLSDAYVPQISGPFVGPRTSTEVLRQQFTGDSIYEEKFSALLRSHPQCRCIKGDGDCGWRAIAFAYFETLLRLGDLARVEAEKQRFRSMCSILDQTGRNYILYEMFLEACEEAFDKVKETIESEKPNNDSKLEEIFNDEHESLCIITHFRLLTGSWLLLHQEAYEAFLSTSVSEYVGSTVDVVKAQIDEIGLQALLDGVIKESGFGVDILYIDRSDGAEATRHHKLEPKEGNPVITLLYRPGHYDILYESEIAEVDAQN